MYLWNKVLLGLIAVASIGFFVLAAMTLKTHQSWGDSAVKHQKKIGQLRESNEKLAEGVEKQGEVVQAGIRQLRIELDKVLADRRRAWFHCEPKIQLDRQKNTAEVTVAIEQLERSGIAADTILYAFDETEAEKGGLYLGEFKVTKAEPKLITLTPTSQLTARELDRLDATKGPWSLYESMPQDGNADPLRDYHVLLGAQRVQSTLMADRIDATARDNKLVDEALAMAKQQEAALVRELAAAKKDLQESTRQRDVVAGYLKKLQTELDATRVAITELIKSNQAKAGRLTELQLEAARRIDQRTRAMAQSGSGS